MRARSYRPVALCRYILSNMLDLQRWVVGKEKVAASRSFIGHRTPRTFSAVNLDAQLLNGP